MATCTEPAFPAQALPSGSLLKKHLTEAVWLKLKDLTTRGGVTLDDCIRSGLGNQDSAIGVYAGDEESVERFGLLFDPLIHDYHGGSDASHSLDVLMDTGRSGFVNPDPKGMHIRSTRIRLVRNLHGYRLMPTVASNDLRAVEQRALAMFSLFRGDLAGDYRRIDTGAGSEVHPGYAAPDRFQLAAGIGSAWPQWRGVFSNPQRSLQIWVNEEDHLRVIAMQPGADLNAACARLQQAMDLMDRQMDFQVSARYGYLASCPSNLGTSLRASFHIYLPRTGNSGALRQLCAGHGIALRSASGEGGRQSGMVYDISNIRRLGLSPTQCIEELLAGTARILALEQSAAA
jgi:protein-arginine kinase